MTTIEVLFCRENLAGRGQEAYQQLVALEKLGLRVQVVKCIIACSECATEHIARVNGQLVTSDTADGLVQSILDAAGLNR
jgi:uncharacterized protein YuzB (UPF0349 family)